MKIVEMLEGWRRLITDGQSALALIDDGASVSQSGANDVLNDMWRLMREYATELPRSIPKREAIIPNDYIVGELTGERRGAREFDGDPGPYP